MEARDFSRVRLHFKTFKPYVQQTVEFRLNNAVEQKVNELIENELEDYKIHNFNGIPKVILVCRERFKDSPMIDDFYSDDWEKLDIKRPGHPNSSEPQKYPQKLEEMLRLSCKLSKGIPFLRTDFYIVEDHIYFGELTFFPASGLSKFEPDYWDMVLGEWLALPK